MREARDPEDGMQWILFVKETRLRNGCSIEEAHQIAHRDLQWRRWVQRRINVDPQCRKMALRHIRDTGDGALIVKDGNRLRVKEPRDGGESL
ncbi:hypothetical protein E5222_04625 [Alteraurantiacibacter aquimixticola]|uniref:Uncharacterized protein n=1 Tax=Alteraurantiacibacter aquimixticola TaxID=2489173 RepID=A0A4T3F8P7_9SPHN|nr:hypothetical protein E5222_04625 [Alteraurantiacibacter aquimixticola]